jgi:hypothetical protein
MSVTKDTPDFGAVPTSRAMRQLSPFGAGSTQGAAFELGAILDAAIDRQPASMVLDVSELDFLGTAELLAISNAEKRLAVWVSR